MTRFRWQHWLGLTLLCFATWSQATIYSSPTLNEANGLVEISPKQAKALATDYLAQRKLADKVEKTPSSISRDETDSRVRTPGSTIDAMKIIAKAQYQLGFPHMAFQVLEEARKLAQQYQLAFLELDVDTLLVRLQWMDDGDASAAREKLRDIAKRYEALENSDQLAKGINYKMTMLRAEIASRANDVELADRLFAEAKPYIDSLPSPQQQIEYHLEVGQHYLTHERYNLALSELLMSYWSAIEDNDSALLAKTNTLLAQLFYERRVLDKTLVHLSQAADFYDNYDKSPALAAVLKRMGDVYFLQGKYNLALVHYFNVIDHESGDNNLHSVIEVRLSLAATYLQLFNYPLAEQYLVRAEDMLNYTDIPQLKGRAALLKAGLAYHQQQSSQVIEQAQQALFISHDIGDLAMEEQAYHLLSLGYEQRGDYANALSSVKHSNSIAKIRQEKLNQISEDAFRQQKEFVEQTLHLVGQEKELQDTKREYSKFQKIAFALFIASAVFFLIVLRRGYLLQRQKEEIDELNTNLYTHSRSRLHNLRMLNSKLLSTLEKSSQSYEQWHISELIHEPLNDRLRFAMIDVPFLRNMYLQHGYSAGLELEHAFGEFIKSKLGEDARLYHFSDANLLYIEPCSDRDQPPEILCNKVQDWMQEFQPERALNRTIRMGIADYPFLPRAYTAINDKELLDILLMAASVARELSIRENSSHWVYLRAIDNAPAASFASNDIRKSCKHAINQGLIKVHSSFKNEEIIKKLLKDG